MTKARWYERQIKRLRERAARQPLTNEEAERLSVYREALRDWGAWQISGNASFGIVWRPKRQGGPYRLNFEVP